jgi:NADH-quinone oxidoreductase subunit L
MRSDLVEKIQMLVVLVPLLPLAGAVLNGLLGRRFPKGLVTAIGCGMPLLAFIIGAIAHVNLVKIYHPVDRSVGIPLFEWMRADLSGAALHVRLGFLFDPLSSVLVLVVTGVGFLIHVYSTGYMAKDPGYRRYFAYLNLFLFCMLVLVLADTLPLLFAGWEGVGLCSYLLIGFWHEDPAKADAGKKAFLVNRVGDLGFMLGMLGYFAAFGTLGIAGADRAAVVRLLPDASPAATTAIALLLFAGAVGKSAQIPLHIWLPDAMAGPTPVSALIHAATMVTAGVYLVARMNFLYAFAESAGLAIAVTGTVTALVAGLAAIAQRDIKKVLAYSTISQLGFMFIAAGLGAYNAAIFHLVTHAFFKALLFLGAGAVIHALHGEQDLFRMGGLSRPLRTIFATMLVGILSLAGIFPLAGFWSKDEILLAAMERGHYALWGCGLAAAFATAFYSARLVGLVFLAPAQAPEPGDPPGHPGAKRDLHRPGLAMTSVLVMLAVLVVLAGALGRPLSDFLQPVWQKMPGTVEASVFHVALAVNIGLSLLVAIAGGALAWYLYTSGSGTLRKWSEPRSVGGRLRTWAVAGFGLDALAERGIARGVRTGAFLLWLAVDVVLIDLGCVGGLAGLARRLGDASRRLQTGVVSHYAVVLALGTAIALGFLLDRISGGGLRALIGR